MISCVRHGEVDDDNMLSLCSACWTWRKLPPDYFPPLINELVCSKENEGHCLSGNISHYSFMLFLEAFLKNTKIRLSW